MKLWSYDFVFFFQDSACKIERKQLQLVGVAAMFIASKYEEMYAPEIGDFVYITDRAYTEPQIREMEMKILSTLSKISLKFLLVFCSVNLSNSQ